MTMRTGCGACCGTCLDMARDLLEASRPSADAPHGNVIPLPVARAA